MLGVVHHESMPLQNAPHCSEAKMFPVLPRRASSQLVHCCSVLCCAVLLRPLRLLCWTPRLVRVSVLISQPPMWMRLVSESEDPYWLTHCIAILSAKLS